MKKNIIYIFLFTLGMIVSCNSKEEVKSQETVSAGSENVSQENMAGMSQEYKKGQKVPNELVCMVNDAYMGRKQMEVPFEDKMYYGCCADCVRRIPNDPAVRSAADPLTGKPVDKAAAYIVLVDEQSGQVAYFENQKNYEEYLKKL